MNEYKYLKSYAVLEIQVYEQVNEAMGIHTFISAAIIRTFIEHYTYQHGSTKNQNSLYTHAYILSH